MLMNDTQTITFHSNARLGNDVLTRNLRIAVTKCRKKTFTNDETVSNTTFIIPHNDDYQDEHSAPIIDASELVSVSFLISSLEDF